jgi:hypothetical protein
MRAFISGFAGTKLSDAERAFLREAQPWGFILFKRNVAEPQAVRALVDDVRATLGRSAPVLIDQEGGRVQRLAPPHWPPYPPGAAYGALYDRDKDAGLKAARLGARLIAADLAALGIDVDCLPLADVPVAGAEPSPRRSRPSRVLSRPVWRTAACCRSSNTFPATGAPLPTATPSFRLSTPRGWCSRRRILRPFGRLPACRWR